MKELMQNASHSLSRAIEQSVIVQIALLAATWFAGQGIVKVTHLPIPGGVVGMLGLILVLSGKWVSPVHFRRGSSSLIGHMALFFVPAMVAFVSHPEFFGWLGVKLIAAVILGTLFVMIGTALLVELSFRWMQERTPAAVDSVSGPIQFRRNVSRSQVLNMYVNQSRRGGRENGFVSASYLESGLE